MDWSMVLILTHLLAFLAGGATARWLTVRNLRVREIEGHLALEVRPHDH